MRAIYYALVIIAGFGAAAWLLAELNTAEWQRDQARDEVISTQSMARAQIRMVMEGCESREAALLATIEDDAAVIRKLRAPRPKSHTRAFTLGLE